MHILQKKAIFETKLKAYTIIDFIEKQKSIINA